MNPLTNVKNITKLNETELASGSIHKKSWHDMYKDSAWIFIGGLSYDLTEGDILAVFSQYGEIVNINLVRDKKTGKTKGFCFLCYSNQKSTILAVDNFNGIKLCNRTLRVDHVSNYKPPKEDDRDDELTKKLKSEGCAPKRTLTDEGTNVLPKTQIKKKKSKKVKKEKKKKKRKNNSDASDSEKEINIKKEKQDPGYDKYDSVPNKFHDRTKQDLDTLQGESSHNYKRKHSQTLKTNNFQYEGVDTDEGKFMKKIKLKRESSQHKESSKDNNQHTTSFKSHKRSRSRSFSDDRSWNRSSDKRDFDKRDLSKNRHVDSKQYKNAKCSNSSSSDSETSSQSSSSGSEKSELKSSYPKKDLLKTHKEKHYLVEEYGNSHHRRKESSYSSSKNRHYEKPEKYSEHWSKSKYRNDDSDDALKKSQNHKSRRDKL